ncbi:MAG TPA: SRPBCC family protein, partial [Chthoniobacterales bacterium]|nr:SRPBCC family protein [Chthoniobacterales bacterium]
MPAATTHSVEVNAPLHSVYNQWTQFEEFPNFMEGVEEVRQEGEKRLFWRSRIAGTVKEWEAEITHQVPDERIAWTSTDGSPNSGTVTFQGLGPDRTRVTATIAYEPEGLLEKTGDALGIPSGRVQGDLERFRTFIEERGRETGGWRGEIEGENTVDSGSASASRSGLGFDKEVGEKRQTIEVESGAEKVNPEQGHRGSVAAEVPLSKEEVKVGKRTVGAGELKLHKKTTTEKVNVPVELKKEDAVVERVSGEEIGQGGKETFQEQHVEVPLSREEPVVEKETHVTGGVRVRKTEGT